MTTVAVSFDDTFHELHIDLDREANYEWPYLNIFYLNFEEKKQINEELNRSTTSQRDYDTTASYISTSNPQINENLEGYRYFYSIPDYLATSSSSFQTEFVSELCNCDAAIDFQDLQQLALLTHQTSIIRLHEQLWYCFLHAGKGELKPSEHILSSHPQDTDLTTTATTTTTTTLSFWPKLVTSIMKSKGMIIQHDDQSENRINQNIYYINFVQNYLHQLTEQAKQRRLQCNTIMKRLPSYANKTLGDKIEEFLRHEGSLIAISLHFQRRIALLEYTSMDRLYQLDYFQQKPTNVQLQIVKQICSLTYDKEKYDSELLFYKFDFLYYKFPKSYDMLENSPPKSITTLSNPVIRQRLSNQYQKIVRQTKNNLFHLFTSAAEAKRDDSQKKYNQEITKIWKNQHQQTTVSERLTSTMESIIEQRQKNIIECIKKIYRLKSDFYTRVPPRILSVIH